MKNLNYIVCLFFTFLHISLGHPVGLEDGIIGDSTEGSGDVDIPFLLPESLEELKKVNAMEKLRENPLNFSANEDNGNLEVITEAHNLLKEVVDRAQDEINISESAMNLLETIEDIPKEANENLGAITDAHNLLKEVVDRAQDEINISESAMNLFEKNEDIPKEANENLEGITDAQNLLKEVADTAKEEMKVSESATNLFEKIKELPKEASENIEAITDVHLLVKEVVDTGEDEVKISGAAMDLFEEIKEIPKEIHDSVKDSAKKVWNKGKKMSEHAIKILPNPSNLWKKASTKTEENSNDQISSKSGFFRFG